MCSSLENFPVVILAGGLGSRLRQALPGLPKALAPVGEFPFLEILVRLLAAQGARRFIFCVGHQAEQIESHFREGKSLGVSIAYAHDGEQLLGTGGALHKALPYWQPHALVLNGDTYFKIDYSEFIRQHLTRRKSTPLVASIALSSLAERDRYGSVLLDSEQRWIVEFIEKDRTPSNTDGWANAGAYVLESELFAGLPGVSKLSLEKELFPKMLASRKKIAAFVSTQPFFDIGTPASWKGFIETYQTIAAASNVQK